MFRKVVLASAIALAAVPAQAALFEVELVWKETGDKYKTSFNKAEDAIDVVDIDYILGRWDGFAENSHTAIANIKFRGVPIQLTYEKGTKVKIGRASCRERVKIRAEEVWRKEKE